MYHILSPYPDHQTDPTSSLKLTPKKIESYTLRRNTLQSLKLKLTDQSK